MTDPTISDQVLLAAIRKRLLAEIESRQQASIVNNVYGGGGGGGGGGRGVFDALGGDPGAFDYFVDINKQDEFDPEGQRIGWNKKVHRFRAPRDGGDPFQKKK